MILLDKECVGTMDMEKRLTLPQWILRIAAFLAGCILLQWALSPLLVSGIFNVGVLALGVGGLAMVLASVFYLQVWHMLQWMWMKRWRRILLLILTALLLLLLLLFIVVSGFMLHAAAKEPPENATVIVLGAAIRGDQPSSMLAARLDAAAKYLEGNPDAVCIVSGGQGADEAYTEASVMKQYLLNKGIAGERIFTEERSTSTYENLLYSQEIIEENGLNREVVIATQEFHQFRAQSFARKVGLESAGACTCHTPAHLIGCYWVREFAGVCKMLLLGY